jgi:tetratricopeptide (TPR) repeat protein
MTCWKTLVPLIACLVVARTSMAKDLAGQERAARTACLAGDYARGITILSELFVATNNPDFIYNQGRCFEQNRRYDDAIARFQEFLRVAQKVSKADKSEVQKHITSCQDLLAKQGGLPSSAGGADVKDAKERSARKACLSGNVDKGAEILTDLYLDYKDPTHIYNLGRCYEQNHRYEDAVSRFREYLLKASKLTTTDRVETEKHIATCLAYLGKSESPQATQSAARQPAQQSSDAEKHQPAVTRTGATSVEGDAVGEAGLRSTRSEPPPARPGPHARQPGVFFQFERVLIPGVCYGIVAGLEVEAGALIGYYKGGRLGLRYLLLDGAIKPGLGLALPLFVVDGKAVAGVEGSAILQWDITRHAGLYASLGLSYFPRTASDLGSLWFLPGIGAQVRL